jgi:hypothetical protein
MKVQIATWRVIKTYLILGLIIGVLFYAIPGFVWPPTITHYFIIGLWLVSTVIYIVLSLTKSYYLIEDKKIVQQRYNKQFVYRFDEIIFIDEAWSSRHKTARFVTSHGHLIYLPFDKQGRIYQAMLNRCNNVITLEDVKSRFPHLKL